MRAHPPPPSPLRHGHFFVWKAAIHSEASRFILYKNPPIGPVNLKNVNKRVAMTAEFLRNYKSLSLHSYYNIK